MVTQAELLEYRRGQEKIDELVRRDVQQLWDGLGAIDPDVKRDLLMDLAPGLVARYGPVAATLAAEFFAETVLLRAEVPEITTGEAVRQSTRSVIGGLWTGQELSARDRLADSMVRHARQWGRSTIRASVGASGGQVRFARVLGYSSKKGPCSWCRTLASRGAVYHSEATAGGLDHWHDVCRCDAIAVRSPDDFPAGIPGYDDIVVNKDNGAWMPRELYEEYDAVHGYLDDDRMVAAKMREKYGYT